MIVLFVAIIAGFMLSIRVMTQLSIQIQHLRERKDEPLPKPSDPFGGSFHGLPIPFFKEYSDTREISHLIIERNRIVLGFWVVLLSLIIIQFVFEPIPFEE